jgi:hypothetical protein
MIKPIEVRSSDADHRRMIETGNEVMFTISIIREMKAKGIPVVGTLFARTVSSGRLECWMEGITHCYRWTPPATPVVDDDDEL